MHTIKLPAKAGSEGATVRRWAVTPGTAVGEGDLLVVLDTQNALVEVTSPVAGVLQSIDAEPGTTITPGSALGSVDTAATPKPAAASTDKNAPTPKPAGAAPVSKTEPNGDVTPLLMPQAGNTMEEGTITQWFVKEGDTIALGDVIYEIETDKATVEVEADAEGKLARIAAEPGDIIPVKDPVAYLADDPADVDAYLASQGATSAAGEKTGSVTAPTDTPSQSQSAAPVGNVTPLLMPQAGNTMEEGTITQWFVKEGDTIALGDVIYEIETDKATVEVEADAEGKLARIVAEPGDIIPVKDPVAYLADDPTDVDAYLASQQAAPAVRAETTPRAEPAAEGTTRQAPRAGQQAAQRTSAPAEQGPAAQPAASAAATTASGRVKASPAARKLAAQRGIDLASLPAGSGPRGRILSTDVEKAPAAAAAAAAPAAIRPAPPTTGPAGQPTRQPLTKMRRAIARNLQVSKQQVPHFYMKLTVAAEPMMAYYRSRKADFKVSLNDVVTLATARAIAEFPEMRSRMDGEEIATAPSANIGIAVGTDAGLTVPVIVGADRMDLQTLAGETRRIVDAARNGQLEGIGQGVFTITNLGMFGVEEFSAIINPPEAGILAVGTVKEEVIVQDGAMRPGKTVALTLSADHRVVDGLLAAKFMARLKELLEHPEACE